MMAIFLQRCFSMLNSLFHCNALSNHFHSRTTLHPAIERHLPVPHGPHVKMVRERTKDPRGLKYVLRAAIFIVLLLPTLVLADPAPLPGDQAFKLSVSFRGSHAIVTTWHIAPRYFLYAKRMKIQLSPSNSSKITYPQSIWHTSGDQPRERVYAGEAQFLITLTAQNQPVVLQIHYQGCAQDGFCYPPEDKQFMVDIANQSVVEINHHAPLATAKPAYSFLSLLTNQNQVDVLMKDRPFAVILFFFAVLGLLLTFTPCVLPMIPILTALILGQRHAPGSRKAFFLSLTYVLGMSLTYAGAGLLTAWLGRSLQVFLQQPVVIAVMSGLFVLLALSLFGVYDLRLPRHLHNRIHYWSNKHEGGTYVGVFMMGILATLIVSPCVTAPLIGVLIYISQTGDLMLGASALFVMGLGMGIPLILIGTSAGTWVPKTGNWMRLVKGLLGILMIIMALWLVARMQSPTITDSETHHDQASFIVVHDLQTLKQQLSFAKKSHRLVLLDFYASWCAECVTMDRHVFNTEPVQQVLTPFLLLRVDLSANTAEDGRILQYFHVIAPPTVLFFNRNGQEVDSERIVGALDAQSFLTRIQAFFKIACDKQTPC